MYTPGPSTSKHACRLCHKEGGCYEDLAVRRFLLASGLVVTPNSATTHPISGVERKSIYYIFDTFSSVPSQVREYSGLEQKNSHVKMAAPYDVETYLLDKANIQDTMVRMVRDPPVSFLPSFTSSSSFGPRLFSWNRSMLIFPTDAQLRYESDFDAHRFGIHAGAAPRLRSVLGRIA